MKRAFNLSVLRAALLIAGLLCLIIAIPTASAQDEVSDLLGRINALRASKGLPPYTLNSSLSVAAQSQSQWLIDNACTIAHTHPDGSTPRSRAQAAGYGSSEVGENIYCGTMATLNDAWIFWLNSPIHYAGLVNTRYKEVGIGIAHSSDGSGFTLDFGNPGGPDFVPPAAPAGAQSASAASGPPAQPAYVVGVDAHGNIEHQVQDGDTIGDILLIYGYTWADIPTLLALNHMTQDDFRDLKVGSILLIPPKAGTYTPTPGDAPPTGTPDASSDPTDAPAAQPEGASDPTATLAADPTNTLEPDPTNTLPPDPAQPPTANSVVQPVYTQPYPTNTGEAVVNPSATVMQVAMVATAVPVVSVQKSVGVVTSSTGTSPALILALVVQVAILLGAGFEFVRRARRRKL